MFLSMDEVPLRDPNTRILGYARVSTQDQDLALQVEALNRWRDPMTGRGVDRIFEECGSGAKMDRPGWNNLMRASRSGDTIVIWRMDRLGRTLTGVIDVVEQLRKQNINLVSLRENLDTATATGKAMFRMGLIFAELERDLISERTKAGIQIRKSMGVRFGQKHSIKDNPKRLEAFLPYVESGEALTMTPREALEILNRADRKAKPITSFETFRRWRREGFEGIE